MHAMRPTTVTRVAKRATALQAAPLRSASATLVTSSTGRLQARSSNQTKATVAATTPFPLLFSPFSSSPSGSSAEPHPLGSIPVIDLSGTRGSGPDVDARRLAVAATIDRACRDIGFFTVVGHGVPKEVIQRMQRATHEYFDRPEEEKNRIPMTAEYPYGYSGFGGESLSKGYGEEGRPDPKECFAIGPSNPAANMPPVQWPEQPAEFRAAWEAYYGEMERLAAHLLSLFATALKLRPDWFEDKISAHRSALRALNYPASDKPMQAGEIRAGAHTDYGSLTILLQDSVGGLQVRNRRNEWVDAVPRADSFVINLGDLMARWSNDRWVSTLHRVVQPAAAAAAPPQRRQSIAFFHNLNADAMVEAIPTCVGPNNPPKYEPIKAWDLLMSKHSSATTY